MSDSQPLHADEVWDAGNTACGDLVLLARIKMKALAPGQVLHLIARDVGAIEDMPAWCRLTGHDLLKADHPNYWIRRK